MTYEAPEVLTVGAAEDAIQLSKPFADEGPDGLSALVDYLED